MLWQTQWTHGQTDWNLRGRDKNPGSTNKYTINIRKSIKITATSYHIFELKCTKFDCSCGSARNPAKETYSWSKGARRGNEGKVRGEKAGEWISGRDGKVCFICFGIDACLFVCPFRWSLTLTQLSIQFKNNVHVFVIEILEICFMKCGACIHAPLEIHTNLSCGCICM